MQSMRSDEIRERYLAYFERNGHARVASSPVIPWGDPTLMFTNAGMNQFKNVFLGLEKRDFSRATTCQKCIRAGGKHNDLDEVGRTTRHGTFLEMLGNFSFGDYFKKDAIRFAWEFLTAELGLPPERLYPSVYSTDDEAAGIWRDMIGVPEARILRLGNIEEGDEENFWSMGPTGPCGPCSELYFDRGPAYGPDDPYQAIEEDAPRFLEIWNLVFMQFNRDESGEMTPLPKPSIDTGLGLERTAMIMQEKDNIFETDILGTLIRRVEELSGRNYSEETGMPFRVAADHIRTLTFAIADGAIPSNEGRGYVLRRILRRASRYLRKLDLHEPVLFRLVDDVVKLMGEAYPEITERADYTALVIKSEEERFLKTLDQGIDLFEQLASDVEAAGKRVIAGGDAFRLYDTYGFPVDLTSIMAEEKGMIVDMQAFEAAMEEQRNRAREASSFRATGSEEAPWNETAADAPAETEFLGYEQDTAEARLVRWRTSGSATSEAATGAYELVFDRTPFYALSGGQVSDTGVITSSDGALSLRVVDVYDTVDKGRVHVCEVSEGEFSPEVLRESATLAIDAGRRRDIERNHSATHLLQAALQHILGDHVRQSGSAVEPDRFRFDFNHFSGLSAEEIGRIEDEVNRNVIADAPVEVIQTTLDKARRLGAMSLFDEKYGDTVRLVRMGDISRELCGGTHVKATGRIGPFRILSESSVAAGIRRIEASTGMHAYRLARYDREIVGGLARTLNASPDELAGKVEALAVRIRELEKEIKRIRTEGTFGGGAEILSRTVDVDGVKVASGRVEAQDANELKSLADAARDRLGSGVAVLGAVMNGKVSVVVTITDDLIQKRSLKAGDIVKKVAELVGGSGGGRPHMAMAGGKDAAKLDDALDSAPDVVKSLLK